MPNLPRVSAGPNCTGWHSAGPNCTWWHNNRTKRVKLDKISRPLFNMMEQHNPTKRLIRHRERERPTSTWWHNLTLQKRLKRERERESFGAWYIYLYTLSKQFFYFFYFYVEMSYGLHAWWGFDGENRWRDIYTLESCE